MAVRTLKPTSAGRRFQTILNFDEITKVAPGEGARRHQEAERRPELAGPHHDAAHRRRAQAEDPDDRLPAREARGAGEGGGDRVRPEPQRPPRAAALPRRGEALHPRARRAQGGRHRRLGPERRHPARQRAAARGTSRRARRSTTWSSSPARAAQLCRSAGTGAQLVAKEGEMAHVKLPSGEIRLIRQTCLATIGQVGNLDHENVTVGKAGRSRWLGIRPTVRGVGHEPGRPPDGRRRGTRRRATIR